MLHFRAELGRKVLVQGAAHDHVHQLFAAADGQDGLAAGKRGFRQKAVAIIPHRVHMDGLVPDLLPVPLRAHILSAGEDDAVQRVQQLLRPLIAVEGGQHDGHTARALDGLRVGRGQLGGAGRRAGAGDADDRKGHRGAASAAGRQKQKGQKEQILAHKPNG